MATIRQVRDLIWARPAFMGVLIGAIVLAVVLLLGLRLESTTGSSSPVLRVGKPAPAFALPTSDGDTLRLADLQGEPVWITFWATWCPPCRSEMPDLQEVYRQRGPGRYHYVAVNFGERPGTVTSFLREVGYTLPVVLDPSAEIARDYRVQGLPTHFFIDEEGVVQDIYSGVMTRSQMEELAEDLW